MSNVRIKGYAAARRDAHAHQQMIVEMMRGKAFGFNQYWTLDRQSAAYRKALNKMIELEKEHHARQAA